MKTVHAKKNTSKILATLARGVSVSLIVFIFAVSVQVARAVEDQFIIRQIVGSDTTAPSVPTDLTATAVSQNQIDLSWTASTDNSMTVAGYQVLRGGVFVATSTDTTYSDTGLSAGTLYSYTVTAFDNSDNISAESSAATATTFPADTTSTTTSANAYSIRNATVLELDYLTVVPDTNTTFLSFGTNIPTQAYVYWGETMDYEMGSVASPIYLRDRIVQLFDLLPATQYFFKIELIDGHGNRVMVDAQEFTTLGPRGIVPPANISQFTAKALEDSIQLDWKNPLTDFGLVRIVRSDKFYPRDPFEGEVVYEGRAEQYIDTDVVVGKTYFYTAFTQGLDSSYSSGAVAQARILRPGETAEDNFFADLLLLPKESIHPMLQKFSLSQVVFSQENKDIEVSDGVVNIQGNKSFVVAIDYEDMPEILKTIVVTIHDPADNSKIFSFLLRVNERKTAYEAHIAPLGRSGEYPFTVHVLDHKHQGLVSLAGTIVSNMPTLVPGQYNAFFEFFSNDPTITVALFASLLALLALMFGIMRNRLQIATKIATAPGSFITK
jgi:hypothetical protein